MPIEVAKIDDVVCADAATERKKRSPLQGVDRKPVADKVLDIKFSVFSLPARLGGRCAAV
jgi:hypothetical protein